DDLLFPNLTVYENLYYKLKLCLPKLTDSHEINKRIENLLNSVGLYEQRNMIVGDVMNKRLSGGQRRRLNIALELVMGPVIIILDEPTSGLSSKDSENIVDFLNLLKEQGKIIITSIHQPNAVIFKRFDKVLLMDRGGVQVFFSPVESAFQYFNQELRQCHNEELMLKQKLKMPELFFDLLEYADTSDKRLYSPDYWEEKYRNHSFRNVFEQDASTSDSITAKPVGKKQQKSMKLRNLLLLLHRNFKNKLRSKLNLLMTLFVSPFLALAVAFVLRGTPEGIPYSFYQNQNSLLFDFISVIIFIFIGLANSIDDILGEKRIIIREQKLGVNSLCQLTAKHLVLFTMTLVQVLLYYFIAELVLSMRGYLAPKGLFYLLSGMAGYSMGLFFSAMIKDRAAIINILPLVIIPQIMFSGAVIQFAEMNKALKLNPNSEIPEFCQIIPSRWLYEGMVIGSARINSYALAKQRYLANTKNAVLDPNISVEEYMKIVDGFAAYEATHLPDKYLNHLTDTTVGLAHGRFVNQPRNIFLSHKMMLSKNKEISTLYLDIIISAIFILGFYLLSLIKLKYWYR
ncbi:MAG TPA: ABC transporter permease, partial [Candidatus Cloacimonadota bacterium]|nr:ABC transporter permease [Candidatus Cloacimonadota bacterium]